MPFRSQHADSPTCTRTCTLPASLDGHVYLLTAIDKSTRWLKAVPLLNKEASTCTDAFLASWVPRFGVVDTVTTGSGDQFTSAIWISTCTRWGNQHLPTTALPSSLRATGWWSVCTGKSKIPFMHVGQAH
jgi:hypothetical protein